ncbi:phosphatidate cytidylyltransferase [Exiguobacterium sp.]|uniref:phosphatidate cytidylyltransferase n=1 Tax=Exiguobacterium sp. TaxID=44751 RepID=UPI000E7E63C5|nr:phosphatidate cytidylyltransferase [Exiguobacterium sp.]HAL01074.1 phosphatidate cytidylyltransferase [Exiguobacterium sp.]HBF58336.1 phosphatidate cytidylyltransferase [Exiguobacterium sp.]
MKTRIITGIWAGAIFLALLYLGGLPFLAFMAILTLLGYTELVRMRQWSGSRVPRILFGIGTLLPFVGIYEEAVDQTLPIGLSPIAWAMIILLIGLFWNVFSKNVFTFDDVAFLLLTAVYVGVGFASFAYIRLLEHGLTLSLLIILLIWFTDSGAYFVGKRFGKNKLWPSISPNKTIEGAVGGVLLAILLGVVFEGIEPTVGFGKVIVLAIIVAVVGQLGDLVQSAYKRHYGVKDSGTLLPGHGGILDRFDSMMIVFTVLVVLDIFA